jgi:hypothetical protein
MTIFLERLEMKVSALFTTSFWNFCDIFIVGVPRTNNAIESWNRLLKN